MFEVRTPPRCSSVAWGLGGVLLLYAVVDCFQYRVYGVVRFIVYVHKRVILVVFRKQLVPGGVVDRSIPLPPKFSPGSQPVYDDTNSSACRPFPVRADFFYS